MTAPATAPSAEFESVEVRVDQEDRYRFRVSYPGTSLPSSVADEGPPLGTGAGPDPALVLASAVAHCLSSTLFNTMERSHIGITPIRTSVTVRFGRNAKGRKRVATLEAQIECAPLDEADRERFQRGAGLFEDYCTVTGSVREGVEVRTTVHPPTATSPPAK